MLPIYHQHCSFASVGVDPSGEEETKPLSIYYRLAEVGYITRGKYLTLRAISQHGDKVLVRNLLRVLGNIIIVQGYDYMTGKYHLIWGYFTF